MDVNLQYNLTMKGPNEFRRNLIYHPHTSDLFWEDTKERINLEHIGFEYEDKRWKDFKAISPEEPGTKSLNIKTLKIQMGLKCNYACSYCSQAHQPHDLQGNMDDCREFISNLGFWFDGGPSKNGDGIKLEFWGGEPLVYWKQLKYLASIMRSTYPRINMSIITNASLLTDEIIDFLDTMDFSIGISHDGPAYSSARGSDPLEDPKQLNMIKKLYNRLMPSGRISFNCVLTKDISSFVAVGEHISKRLNVPIGELNLGSEENLVPYDAGGMALSPKTDAEHRNMLETLYWEAVKGQTINTQTIKSKCEDFYKSIVQRRPSTAVGQKCGMDDPHTLSVDLKGNVTTCQNMSADTYHKIGTVEEFDKISLDTSWHWTKREECVQCPVVQLCKGSCMFNTAEFWKQGCDNAFTYNTALLGISLYYATGGLILESMNGEIMRRPGLPTTVSVINYDENKTVNA